MEQKSEIDVHAQLPCTARHDGQRFVVSILIGGLLLGTAVQVIPVFAIGDVINAAVQFDVLRHLPVRGPVQQAVAGTRMYSALDSPRDEPVLL